MAAYGYKKYMKQDAKKNNPLIKIFVISFFGMLLVFTSIINYMSKVVTVDTSIGDYKEQKISDIEDKKIIDVNSLQMIQNEDQGKNFSEIMHQASDVTYPEDSTEQQNSSEDEINFQEPEKNQISHDVVYKVYVGSYTSAEQAKVANEIIQDADLGLSPIVKCIGANNYTLLVGTFKNKQNADNMLTVIKNNNLPGKIVQE